MEGPGYMSEGERNKLEHRLAQARRLAAQPLDALTRERIDALIRDLEQRLAALAQSRDDE
ncbi:MAG: hypothetical protein WA303_21645 [Bradyrhizobium sp.]